MEIQDISGDDDPINFGNLNFDKLEPCDDIKLRNGMFDFNSKSVPLASP